VHNAVDVDDFSNRRAVGDYVLWVGRFTRDKGPDLAIDAARAAGRPIVLAGKCTEPDEQNYFDAEIAPRLGPGVEYAGEVGCEAKKELFGRARALVFPIRWDEPFGMVMAEAMASGTPVVATRRGSVAELVADGVSGVVLDADSDAAAIAEGIQVAERLDRDACRKHARTLFSVAAMATGYERVYDAVR
jgi:glycosyltransferase involved in cell wall biosynthesis